MRPEESRELRREVEEWSMTAIGPVLLLGLVGLVCLLFLAVCCGGGGGKTYADGVAFGRCEAACAGVGEPRPKGTKCECVVGVTTVGLAADAAGEGEP